jgi:hypothetical protein
MYEDELSDLLLPFVIMSAIFIYTCIVLFNVFGHEINAVIMNYSIINLWNSYPIPDHRFIEITLSSTDDKEHLFVEINAPFYNDPAPPSPPPPGPYPGLYNYEVVEIFFLNSSTNHYIELEFAPHGQYLVILLTARRQTFKQLLPLPDYTIEFPSSDRWIGRVHIPRSLFPSHIDRFNAYGIHGQGDNRTYEALYPAPKDSKQPDFHRLELFQPINFDSLLYIGDKDGDSWNNK